MDRRKFLVSAGVAALAVAGSTARAASKTPNKKAVEDTPVILEVAISGTNSKKNNPLVPESAEEQIAEMDACLDAGATIVHSHSNHPSLALA